MRIIGQVNRLQEFIRWFFEPGHRPLKYSSLLLGLLLLFFLIWQIIQGGRFFLALDDPRNQAFVQWASGDEAERQALIVSHQKTCPNAPFILPTDGFIGLLYGDPRGPYSADKPHQGIDIFSDGEPGITPVYAAYDGYVTREANWRSALILRIPDDPLRPGEQIWLYYTHMADQEGSSFIVDAFPPGTEDFFVEQGTLLGYTGDYNGNSLRTIWVHLHFSIVKDDGNGRYLNELQFSNTLDPSPYLGMSLNYKCGSSEANCTTTANCP